MSTSKKMDAICITAIAIAFMLTIFLFSYKDSGLFTSTTSSAGYEERLFNTDKVHTVDIVMNDWDSFIEGCESESYSACSIVIDGEKFSNVGIRAKGNTSLSNVKSMDSQRYSFKLEFDQYEEGKSYYGLDKLCLNNIIQDNTMMKDYLVYQMMEDFGVDSPLSSYVYITVNGEDWGLYLAVESIEDSFLERNYGSDTGDLYKPDSMSFGGGKGNGREFNMDDFDFGDMDDVDFSSMTPPNGMGMPDMNDNNPSSDNSSSDSVSDNSTKSRDGENTPGGGGPGGFGMGSDDVKLKYIDDDPDSYSNIFNNAKTVVTSADKTRLISALKNLNDYTNLEDTIEIEEVLRYFVIHNFVCNGDSYTGSMIHNYYLHENDGKLSMIPWDYNLAYGTFQGGNAQSTINTSIDSPVSGGDLDDRPMVGWIFSDEEYTEMYHEYFAEFVSEWYTSGRLAQLIEDTANMIRPYVEKDPTKFCTTEEFEEGVATITEFVNLRFEAVERQLNGDDTPVDASGLNTSAMGSMNNGGGMGPGGNRPDESISKNTEETTGSDTASTTGKTHTLAKNPDEFGGDHGGFKPGQGDFKGPPDVVTSATIDVNKDNNGFSGPPGSNSNYSSGLSSNTKNWLYLIGSIVTLGIGLVFAFKKKY